MSSTPMLAHVYCNNIVDDGFCMDYILVGIYTVVWHVYVCVCMCVCVCVWRRHVHHMQNFSGRKGNSVQNNFEAASIHVQICV